MAKNNYYFTFGQVHRTIDGISMKDNWVRVIAKDYISARKIFIEQFSSINMESPDKWAFQYEEDDFNPNFFPSGEYLLLTEKDDEANTN